MYHIEQVFDNLGLDWGVHEATGTYFIQPNSYNPEVLSDISTMIRRPMNALDYGSFVAILPRENVQRTIDMLKKFGYKLKDEPIIGEPSSNNINTIVNEVVEELNTKQLFEKFGKAMRILGKQMNVGPIQDLLKQRGINWRTGDDGASLIFYVSNNGNEQPIARISAESLGTQNDFQEQLFNMVDFATGSAPGTFKQKQEELRDQEQLVRDISKTVWSTDDGSKVANMMLSDDE